MNTTFRKYNSKDKFLSRLLDVNPDYKDDLFKVIGEYKGVDSKILCKDKYGYFTKIARRLLNQRTSRVKTNIRDAAFPTAYFKETLRDTNSQYKCGAIKLINDYIGANVKVKLLTEFGVCEAYPYKLWNDNEVTIKHAVNKHQYWVNQSLKMHGDIYQYETMPYLGNDQKVNIICKKHGVFQQARSKHLCDGQGCPACSKSTWGWGHWNELGRRSKLFDGYKVYIIECVGFGERFFKIGKTYTSINVRFKNQIHMPYSYYVMKVYEFDCGVKASEFELELLNKHKEFSYMPTTSFAGETECFTKLEYGKEAQT